MPSLNTKILRLYFFKNSLFEIKATEIYLINENIPSEGYNPVVTMMVFFTNFF